MDSTAFQELIAQIRGASTAVAQAEQKVAAAKTELAQQKRGAQLDARSALWDDVKPTTNRSRSGWLPAG
jgi:hypothetical protein